MNRTHGFDWLILTVGPFYVIVLRYPGSYICISHMYRCAVDSFAIIMHVNIPYVCKIP